ncbi:putative methyltransferase PMT26 [Cocos nucifera]|nr:putative methyltransferase PMT26 [Cocos nucifera]
MLAASTALVAAALLLLDLAARTEGGAGCCDAFLSEFPPPLANSTDLDAAFRELIARNWLSPAGRALCVGPGSSAAAAAARRLGLRTVAVAAPAAACCGLPFAEASFDFAFSAALDRARVPARVILEMERVLLPGRVGAVFWFLSGPVRPDGLMKAAAPVASWLRFSEVVAARAINGSAMVVFKKTGFPGQAIAGVGGGTSEAAITRLPLSFNEIIELLGVALLVRGGSLGKLV